VTRVLFQYQGDGRSGSPDAAIEQAVGQKYTDSGFGTGGRHIGFEFPDVQTASDAIKRVVDARVPVDALHIIIWYSTRA
jgi:hypothetical protein